MGRAPCCEKIGMKQGKWTKEEDELLAKHIKAHGEGSWRSLPEKAGLLRCGKSCRLRWINYLRAGLKRGCFSREEDELIIKLHATLGNRWSQIARELPGRTDNEIKNYWNSHLGRSILPGSHHVNGSSSAKMTQPTKKIKKIRKKKTIVEEVINPQTSLKHCNETVQSEFSSLSDEALWNSENDAFNEPSTSKEEIINGPSSPDLNSIFKEIDNLLNSEIEETNVADGSLNNMPDDTDTQNGSILVPKDADALFGDLECLDFLWDQDIWSSLGSEDEPLWHIIV